MAPRPHLPRPKLAARRPAAAFRNRARLGVELLESRELLSNGANLGSIGGLTDTPSERFVTQLYYDLLQRVPTAAEVAGWVGALNAGAPPAALPPDFVSSAEYQTNLINDDYYTILQRQASPAEVRAWLGLALAGTSAEQLRADFLASGEFYQKQGGTPAGWLNGVYQNALGRSLDPYGLSVWSSLLQRGVSRAAIARAIVTSQEADALVIASVYHQLLNRNPGSAEVSAWVAVLGQGVTQEQFIAAVAGSGEYYQQAAVPPVTQSGTQVFSSAHFDLNAKNSPTAPGYTGVPMTAYGAGLGYGWASVVGLGYRNRFYSDPLKRDFQYGSDGTFEVNVLNGYYAVTTTLGDASSSHTNIAIYLNGTLEASGINTAAGQWRAVTFGVQVTNGLLSIRVRSTGGTFAVDGFDIVQSMSFQVTGFPASTTAGTAGSFTVTALNASGNLDTGYTGTVHFTSSDPQATLPPDYTFTGGDQGVHTFSATLKTAGTQSLTATDSTSSAITGSQSGIAVTPGAATQLSVSAPAGATAGQAFSITVTAQDAYGNTATGYTGTVHFTSSDGQATLPADYTFAGGDQGVHTFSVTLVSMGSQTITATDTGTASITGTATLTVTSTGPVTSWHYAPNGDFVNGQYVVGQYGFNLADVSSVSDLSMLPAGDKALVYLGMGDGVTTAFINAVTPFIGDSRVFAFYLVDEPDPTGRWHPLVLASNLKAESDWIHTNDPGAKTFIVLMNLGDDTNPTYQNSYNTANTDIDYFGLDPYPVQTQFNGADYNIIPAAVSAAEAWGITLNQIIPVYQAFGGGGYSSWILPTASQAQQILATWASVVPNPAFDYTYSWGIQNNDSALVNTPALQSVFAAHNA
jgi:hypothetical protein